MPTYVVSCPDCHEDYILTAKMAESHICTKCQSPNLIKKPTRFAGGAITSGAFVGHTTAGTGQATSSPTSGHSHPPHNHGSCSSGCATADKAEKLIKKYDKLIS